MSTNDLDRPDPEDMFADTRMSFGDHIEDLRTHLLRAIKGFVIGMLISLYPLGHYVMRIIVDPVETQLEHFEKRVLDKEIEKAQKLEATATRPTFQPIHTRVDLNKSDLLAAMLAALGFNTEPEAPLVLDTMMLGIEGLLLDIDEMHAQDDLARRKLVAKQGNFIRLRAQISDPRVFNQQIQKQMMLLKKPRLSTMNITEAFMVYFKVAMMTGFVISSPWVFYHLWAFIAAGLYPSEKRLVNVYLPFSLTLFLSGVLICQFFVMPKAIEAMLWFNEWLGIGADLRLNEWLGFALMMPLVFGISFQTPLVMLFLNKVGILTVEIYRDYRRISWFVMAVFAAVITPSVDAFSMLFLWVPMGALYELGILLCIWQGQQESLAEWEIEERKGEIVEV